MKVITSALYLTALSLFELHHADAICENDAAFEFVTEAGNPHKCTWLKKGERKDRWCGEDFDGRSIGTACKRSCGRCNGKVPSAAPAAVPIGEGTGCWNDRDYRFTTKSGSDKRCIWLTHDADRKKRYCDGDYNGGEVLDACPKACGACDENSEPPTENPAVVSTPLDPCFDNTAYFFDGDATPTCESMRGDESRRQELCMDTDVALNCPTTCGHCCENDVGYEFNVKNGSTKKCRWLHDIIRKEKWCGTSSNGQSVENACRKSCGNCYSKVTKPSPFSMMPENTNECPNGLSQVTYYQCFLYAESVGMERFYDMEYYLSYSKNDMSGPKGCYLNSENGSIYYNWHSTGASAPNLQPVCILPETYKEMRRNTNTCTKAYDLMTYAQCEGYAASQDQNLFRGYYKEEIKAYYQYSVKNFDDRPKGCYIHIDSGDIYFNESPTGSSNIEYMPVCIEPKK